ncbi:MFS transporter [Naasia aerilata]|uniref:Permease of the major facilitator superfamily protein n=1 Tax=Naasia aerilata TaxID=1162966 RepID=A0ABM8G7X6_9MICO|nr:putative permease of the major facilitator superfamily protein [Naasia aerilata]
MPELSPARVRLALLALALGGFGIGCTEFVAMGLLPNLARDLLPDVYAASPATANGQAGALIAAYAMGVVVGAPTIAAFSARFARKKLLLVLLAVVTVATIASATLPSFGLVFAARFVAALPHGAYFGVASLVAASLLGPGKRGQGVAFVIGGLTIANVVGVPAITWLGQETGWRMAYVAVAAVFALTFLSVAAVVPAQPGNPGATVGHELKAFRRPQVWFALGIGSVGFSGLFAVYTYISPIATDVTGLPLAVVPIVLVVFGLGMTVGNFAGGWFVDRGVKRALLVAFGGTIVALAVLLFTVSTAAGLFACCFLLGAAIGGGSIAIQVRLLDVAGDSQTIAAAVNHSALNIGNTLGAALGGAVVAAGLGYVAPVGVGLALSVVGVLLAIVSFTVEARQRRRIPAAAPARSRELVSDPA